ncbi:hypothetical protein [uncultured Devosia sp.]|uniref:hypothetical protein n=1 Tax=uncultured Devosia sp. TaxID=211434 RepID=UPI0035C95D8A
MTEALQTLRRGDSLATWQVSAVIARDFAGEPAPAHDPQHYHYVNGFVDVGDLPCRVATWREVATRERVLERDWAVEALYLPGPNRRVAFSQFCHTPMRLERWCRTWLTTQADRFVSFRLFTRGGIHIWVDGQLAARFEPFTRNSTESSVVHLPLRAAGSEVVVLTEDMAERDTDWFFELVQIDDVAVGANLQGTTAPTRSARLAQLAEEVRCAGEVVSTGPIRLVFDTPAAEPVSIAARIGSTSHDRSGLIEASVTLAPGQTGVDLCDTRAVPQGYVQIALVLRSGTASVERTIGCAVLRSVSPMRLEGDLPERKALVLDYLARNGELRMGTALAMLAAGHALDERFRTIVERTLDIIEARHDCCDFVLVPLLWAIERYGSAFPADLLERAQVVILGFRYWVDEPGNDVMWFWSENHALCFHVSQLLAGGLYPEAVFSASGRTGAEQRTLGAQRLGLWFDAIEEDGLAEWNSAAYYPVDLVGLLALAELAAPELAARAVAACDRIFTIVALHSTAGVPAGSMGRAYDKELRAGPLTELAPFVALAWGRGWLNRGVAALPEFAASGYAPPEGLDRLAWPAADVAITAQFRQGFGEAARLHLFKTADLQLSTNAAAKAGSYGHQQHVVDLLFAQHPFARAWINHPGEDDPWGSQRPSYWAGNGVLPRAAQRDNVAMLLYDLGPQPRLPFTHAYVAAEVITVEAGLGRLVLQAGDGLAALLCTAELAMVTRGPATGREWRADGTKAGWAVVACPHRDAARFRAEIAAARLELIGDRTLRYSGAEGVLELDWETGQGWDSGQYGPEPRTVETVRGFQATMDGTSAAGNGTTSRDRTEDL